MRRILGLAAAAWLSASPAIQAAHVHAPIVIVQQGRRAVAAVSIPDTPGSPAQLKLDILDQPPEAMQGQLEPGVVIASYVVRVSDAVILDTAVKATERELAAGTALARVDTTDEDGKAATLWCDSRQRFLAYYSVDCLQVVDGALRRLWTGHQFTWKFALGVVSATGGGSLPVGVAFRSAKPEERPLAKVGYAYCDGDGVSGPPRFTTAVAMGIDRGWIRGMPYTCTLGTWPEDGDHTIVSVDRIRLKVQPGRPLAYKVISGLLERQILSASAGRPPLFAGPRQDLAGSSAKPPEVRRVRVLEPTGPASFIASGLVRPGEELLRVPVRHGITGVLINSVSYYSLFGGRTYPAGQPVYGVPMSNGAAGERAVVWCALGTLRNATISTCFPHDGVAYRWVDVPGPFAGSFVWSANSIQASAPSVKVTMDDIHTPMELSYRFIEWKDGQAVIAMSLSSDPRSRSERRSRYFPLPDQGVVLDAVAAHLQLRPATDGAAAIVTRLPSQVVGPEL